MIYHTFPKVTDEMRYEHMDVLATSDDIHKTRTAPAYPEIETYARRWCDAGIARVDTLRELEQWIPFSRLRNDFPIYKFYFSDKDKHQLYVSSVSGEALQFTNKNNRFWAWLGAIPHWVYFTSLRWNSQLWMDVVIWLSGLGCIMCIAGIIIGLRSYIVRYRKKKKWETPYKKPAYKWHHILGFIFGIFVFTFVFSGMMSLATVPKWMVKVHNPDIQRKLFASDTVALQNYTLDYRKIIEQYKGEIKSIELASFGDVPLYKAIIGSQMYVFDASGDEVKLLEITGQMIENRLSKIHSEQISITLMHEYDNYYVDKKNRLPLPVYKVDVSDADNSTYYINLQNGNIRYFNTNTKVRRWTYQVLHSFKLGFLVKRPVLWNIIMWTTMIGGTLVSLTGVWLGVRYVGRWFKSRKRK
jgi:hypothetical protein